MIDYFPQLIGLLKAHDYMFVAQGSGGYEVWRRRGRCLTVPNRCMTRLSANGVLAAAKIRHRF